MTLAMSGATPQDSGLASGFINTTVQVGGAVGLAVLATLSTERTESLVADGESVATALNSGYHLAYLIGAALTVVAIVVAFVVRALAEAGAAEVEHSEARRAGPLRGRLSRDRLTHSPP